MNNYVSDLFKQYSNSNSREINLKTIIGVTEATGNTYSKNEVVSFSIDSMICSGQQLSIGNVIPAKLDMKLKTTDTMINGYSITIYFQLSGSSGLTEWLPVGRFYIDEVSKQEDIWNITAYDALMKFNRIYTPSGGIMYPIKPSTVLLDIITKHSNDSLIFDSDELTYIQQTIDNNMEFTAQYINTYPTELDVIKNMAIALCSNVILKTNTSGAATTFYLTFWTFTDSNNYVTIPQNHIFGTPKISDESKTYRKVIVYKDENTYFTRGDGTEGQTFTVTTPFANDYIADIIYGWVNWLTYKPLELEWIGFLYLDIGDDIKVLLKDGTEYATKVIQNTLNYDGGIKFTTKSPATTETQAAYNNTGGTGYEGGGSVSSIDADKVYITDSGNNFASDNVEGALAELFTFASNGKKLIVDALIKKWVQASYSDSFAVLAKDIDNLLTIPILFVKEVYTGISLTAPTITINTITDSISASIQTPIQSTISETYTGITIDTSSVSITIISITENVTITLK